jgi:DnaJ-class molecular chaperone
MKMPFGKYKEKEIGDIPESYLHWLVDNVDLWGQLRYEVYNILGIEDNQLVLSDGVKSIYRKLAMKYHPDRGGNTMAMQAINEFYEELKNLEE